MDTQEAITAIQDYCSEAIALYPERVSLALDIMDMQRTPIESADYKLADEIVNCIDEWCEDHNCPELAEDISVMDIILS